MPRWIIAKQSQKSFGRPLGIGGMDINDHLLSLTKGYITAETMSED
jgi:hypothetical protein